MAPGLLLIPEKERYPKLAADPVNTGPRCGVYDLH